MLNTEKTLATLGRVILVWLLKGLCIGLGAYIAWRLCHAY